MHVRVCACICVRASVCVYLCMCVRERRIHVAQVLWLQRPAQAVHVHVVCVCMYVRGCMCVCVCAHVCVCASAPHPKNHRQCSVHTTRKRIAHQQNLFVSLHHSARLTPRVPFHLARCAHRAVPCFTPHFRHVIQGPFAGWCCFIDVNNVLKLLVALSEEFLWCSVGVAWRTCQERNKQANQEKGGGW